MSGFVISPGMRLLREGAASGANLSLTDIRGFRHYCLWIDAFLPATDGAGLHMLSSTDNGSSYGTSYIWARNQTTDAAANAPAGSVGANTEIELTGPVDNALTNGVTGQILIHKPGQAYRATYTWQLMCHDAAATFQAITGAAETGATADVDAIRLQFSSGNIASGNYALYVFA